MLVVVREVAARLVGAVGGCVSWQAGVDPPTVARCDRFPAASTASTAIVYAVPHVRPDAVALACVAVTEAAPLTYTW